MKMSSLERRFEGSTVTQHRPQDVDPPSRQRDQSLGVLLALSSLALVEGPGVRRTTQAGKRRLVEDSLEDLVATTHPTVVTDAFAGVAGCRHQPGVGGEPLGALKSGEVPYADQKFGSEDRTHPRQASEDPGLGTGEKTFAELLVEDLEALFLRESTSRASSATIAAATSSAGKTTL